MQLWIVFPFTLHFEVQNYFPFIWPLGHMFLGVAVGLFLLPVFLFTNKLLFSNFIFELIFHSSFLSRDLSPLWEVLRLLTPLFICAFFLILGVWEALCLVNSGLGTMTNKKKEDESERGSRKKSKAPVAEWATSVMSSHSKVDKTWDLEDTGTAQAPPEHKSRASAEKSSHLADVSTSPTQQWVDDSPLGSTGSGVKVIHLSDFVYFNDFERSSRS